MSQSHLDHQPERASDEIYAYQAAILRSIASPRRLELIHCLGNGPCTVSRLCTELGLSQPLVSQHLSAMRAVGLVDASRQGREVHYQLADPEILVACDLMRGVLLRHLARMGSLAADNTGAADNARAVEPAGDLLHAAVG